ncbi:MAG: ribonuclease PH [Elusimicrobia bacterium]|nr:ribonuclease PH [Candidatus Obscuribacterium magneticum]
MKKSPASIRPLRFQKSYLPHAEGSCLVSMGNTKVLCVASVSDKPPDHAKERGMGWIHAEYAMLPRAGESRSPRNKVSQGGRVQEISRLIGRTLRAAVDLEKLAPLLVTIDCDVIRADGGTRTASINGGLVALVQALKQLRKKGMLSQWPLHHFVGAVSVGIKSGTPAVDMCYLEDKEADTDMNVVMTESGHLIEIQGTAEKNPFSVKELNNLLNLARRGIRQVIQAQKKALGSLPKK